MVLGHVYFMAPQKFTDEEGHITGNIVKPADMRATLGERGITADFSASKAILQANNLYGKQALQGALFVLQYVKTGHEEEAKSLLKTMTPDGQHDTLKMAQTIATQIGLPKDIGEKIRSLGEDFGNSRYKSSFVTGIRDMVRKGDIEGARTELIDHVRGNGASIVETAKEFMRQMENMNPAEAANMGKLLGEIKNLTSFAAGQEYVKKISDQVGVIQKKIGEYANQEQKLASKVKSFEDVDEKAEKQAQYRANDKLMEPKFVTRLDAAEERQTRMEAKQILAIISTEGLDGIKKAVGELKMQDLEHDNGAKILAQIDKLGKHLKGEEAVHLAAFRMRASSELQQSQGFVNIGQILQISRSSYDEAAKLIAKNEEEQREKRKTA